MSADSYIASVAARAALKQGGQIAELSRRVSELEGENAALRRLVDRAMNGGLDTRGRIVELEAEVESLRRRLAAARSWITEETDFRTRTTSDDRGQW